MTKLFLCQINSELNKLLLSFSVVFCLTNSTLAAQVTDSSGFAVVVSGKKGWGQKAKPGSRVFSDQSYLIKQLPPILSGLDYLPTYMSAENQLRALTEGWLYMVTPLEGQPGSQQQQLTDMGFVNTGTPSFQLFKEQKDKIGVFRKYIRFNKFRLGNISFKGWSVPFFKQSALPSITVAASYTWMPDDSSYAADGRKWQGCPTLEVTGKRTWAGWFSGGTREPDAGNYAILSYSDDGRKWIDPAMVITHPDSSVRVMDIQLWKDPEGRLWVFWTQNTGQKGFDGLWGTWAVYTKNPEARTPVWSRPKRLCDGLTRNKPIVLRTGEWLLPSYDWADYQSAVYMSKDKGNTWSLQGGPLNGPVDNFYEHMCVELGNGDICMLQRNIQRSISKDKGVSWSPLDSLSEFTSANSRLYFGKLRSGKFLIVYNDHKNKRKNLTAILSDDEGRSWPYRLVLDERDSVSYPDVAEDAMGRICVIYDRSREGDKEILFTAFNEEDIRAGAFRSPQSEKKKIISKPGNRK